MPSGFRLVLACTAPLGWLLSGCSTHQNKPADPTPAPVTTSFTIARDVVITPADWPQKLLADVYVPAGAGPWPGVLVIHGGGWNSGDREQVESIAERLAGRGYVAVNTTYRLSPQWRYPAQLEDMQLALRWMQAHAAGYRMRPERFGAFGYSAGAHLAALLGVVNEKGLRPSAVVAGGTPTDLSKYPGGTLVPTLIGGGRAQNLAAYQRASPITHVSAGDPPFFLYHGGIDRLVPLDHAEDFKTALDAAGVYNELFILRGRGHVTAFLSDGPAVDAAIQFLDRHLRP